MGINKQPKTFENNISVRAMGGWAFWPLATSVQLNKLVSRVCVTFTVVALQVLSICYAVLQLYSCL